MDLIIYGAQGYALGAYEAYKTLYPNKPVKCFVVTEMGNNAPVLGGISVVDINTFSEGMSDDQKNNVEFLIATPENVMEAIEGTLEEYGFKNHSRLDSDKWAVLMKDYHAKKGQFVPLASLPVGSTMPSINVFMAKSHKDKPLKNSFTIPDFMKPIQVGADNTEERITDILDNVGDNISKKNVNYCELTGLYWVWKNVLCDDSDDGYYGLAQYRRMMLFPKDDLLRLADNDVDVVLPYPMSYEPDINVHHERYLKDVDWDALLKAISEVQPDYADAFTKILSQKYLYNYNVILAKKSVLREYCEWLFPILERTEELSDPKGSERADRYIGYMGEALETLYFLKNADRLKVVHTGCKLLV